MRIVLAAMEIGLLVIFLRRGLLLYFGAFSYYLVVHAVAGFIHLPNSDMRSVWLWAGTLFSATIVSIDLFRIPAARTYWDERQALRGASIGAGALITWIAIHWQWKASTPFQTAILIRQFYSIALACSVISAWLWLSWIRPVQIPRLIYRHGVLWCLWLLNLSIASTGARNGLLWYFVDWDTGSQTWRIMNIATNISAMVLLALWTALLRPEIPASETHAGS